MVDEVARTFGAKSEIRSDFSIKLTDYSLESDLNLESKIGTLLNFGKIDDFE